MQHFEDRSSMQAPGLCFVCETAPQAGVVDTLQNFTPGFVSPLAGGKYICDGCVKAAAEVCGFYASDDVAAANARADEATARYNAIRSYVTDVATTLTDAALVSAGDRSSFVSAAASASTKPKAKKATSATDASTAADSAS